MLFNSYIFILAFLPIVVIGYFLMNRLNVKSGEIFLILASALFYFYGGWKIAIILIISMMINLIMGFSIHNMKQNRKLVLIINIIVNSGILLYFKYYNFFIDNVNSIFKTDFAVKNIILPLGISFFTFQQLMYVIKVYRNEIQEINVVDYCLYILYFPKLVMGPLAEPSGLIQQFHDESRKRINAVNIACGVKIFCFGLFKKMILADTFAAAVNWGYNNIQGSTSMDWFLIMLFYTFEIYFDFSGYSDMAIGVSKMMNIDLPMNFDSPYKALSVRDFWKRWHMSLTGFLTRYVYFSLGGSKKGTYRTYLNTMIVFLVSGIWHGANWTFILWGVFHGLFSIFDRVLEKHYNKLMDAVKWAATFLVINILWLLFRSDSIGQWWDLLQKMFTFQNMAVSDGLIKAFLLPETDFLINMLHINAVNTAVRGFNMLIMTLTAFGICLIPENNFRNQNKNSWVMMILAAIAFVWGFLCLSSESVFVYFNF